MSHIPAAKLFSLIIKTLAKPVAKEVRRFASTNDYLKRAVIWMGQTQHKVSTMISVRAAGFSPATIKPLEETKALQMGGELVSEIFIFGVGGGLLVWDYQNTASKNAAKAAEQKAQKQEDARQLAAQLAAIHARLDEIENKVYGSGGIWGLGLGIFSGQKPPARPKRLPLPGEESAAATAAGAEGTAAAAAPDNSKGSGDGKGGGASGGWRSAFQSGAPEAPRVVATSAAALTLLAHGAPVGGQRHGAAAAAAAGVQPHGRQQQVLAVPYIHIMRQ